MAKFDPSVLLEYLDEVNQEYMYELSCLQVELLTLQKHVMDERLKVGIVYEGRDTAGKGGAILRFTQHLNPRHLRVVALTKPTPEEAGQWYFQRYIKHLPDPSKMVFFDRSWYNRAVVEPAMGFCDEEQYERFMNQVNDVERFLIEDKMTLIKMWYSIDYEVQDARIEDRKINPLKMWKLSPVDEVAHARWEKFTKYKRTMFHRTSSEHCPWWIIDGNNKKTARLESIRLVLNHFDYPDKGFTGVRLDLDSKIVRNPY